MDLFTETTPAETVPNDRDDLIIQINSLKEQVSLAQRNHEFAAGQFRELRTKIDNVKGYFADLILKVTSLRIEISKVSLEDEIKYIAELLGIELTKQISGTARYEISWTAQVPLDFDIEDFEITFDVNCETYEAEDFEWNEDDTIIDAEEV